MTDHRYNLAQLRTELRPFRLYWFPRLRSTNDHAAELRRRGELFAPAAVLAGRQTAGRGRGGNAWWSSGGSITVTFALAIEEHLSPTQLPLAAGLAVRNALAELAASQDIRLKWPNDVVFRGQKLAGVLCERVNRVDLVGIGVNLNLDLRHAPAELRERITSLHAVAQRKLDPSEALIGLARHLSSSLSRRREYPFPAIIREYARHHDLAGRKVTVIRPGDERPITGQCEGLDDTGRLMLRSGNGELHRIVTGHVQTGSESRR